tara:strand:+ start:79 stop:558 length:480 start_codon:yes stop_codon:yes gene_type:complete
MITIVVLIAITVASFSVWQIPDNPKMTIVVTDFESHLEAIDARHEIIASAVDESFSELMNEKMQAEKYIKIAEVSSLQNNGLLMELVESNAPEEWQESYINRITSLKSFELYIIETMVMAEFLGDGDGNFEQKDDLLDKIEKFKEEFIQYDQMADSTKP